MDDSASDGSGYSDIPTRPMRIKVLYSFDQDNKTNCLARLPNTLQIPAVAINETAQVGVIDLQQCIQAIIAASPEIVSRLSDGDYTVYAYDYSEEDTPLVGQGMLSAALATAAGGTSSEQAMITGRVCKNVQALFSNGVKETLEVKLRLAPVAKPAVSVLTKGSSPATTAGFDPNAWNASFQQNKAQQPLESYFDFDASQMGSQSAINLVDEMFGLGSGGPGSASGQEAMGGVGIAETPTDPTYGFNPAFSHSAPGSRAGSPMMGLDSSTFNEHLRHQSFAANTPNFADHSRPASRASVRSESKTSLHQRQASTQSLPPQQPDVYYNEDGQSRKRAKVTQADWHGRSSFGPRSGDLRVTAATAHSVHMHRPIARRAGAPGAELEPPPRVPTPVPQGNPMLRQQRPSQPTGSRSFLRQASTVADSDFGSDVDQFSDAMMSSPDDDGSPSHSLTAEGTPQDIPSSPPILMGSNYAQPSSPGLPTLPPPRTMDSGYMSGNMMEGFIDDDENRSPDAEDLEIAARYQARQFMAKPAVQTRGGSMAPTYPSDAPMSDMMEVTLETPGDMSQLPQRMLFNAPLDRGRAESQGPRPPNPTEVSKPAEVAHSAVFSTQPARPSMAQSRRSSLALPMNAPTPAPLIQGQPASDAAQRPAPPRRKSTKRVRPDTAMSEAGSPAPSDTEGKPSAVPTRSGSGAQRQRREVIQQRLEKSIARNEVPTHCIHCGAIETPTWRRLYIRYFDGKPSPLDEAEGEGETIGIENLERDPETNEVTKFVVRKSMKRKKHPGEGFEMVTVCNPCGLWFNKCRNMRPADKWAKKTAARRSKQPRFLSDLADLASFDGSATDGFEPPSDALFTDAVGPDDLADDEAGVDNAQLDGPPPDAKRQRAPVPRQRANSLQPLPRRRSGDGMNASQLDAALTRAVQSSPVPFRGSQDSPIEIQDLTPRPTRRLLFPSPRSTGEVKSLDDNGQASLNTTPPRSKGSVGKPSSSLKVGVTVENTDVNVFDAFTFDKENMEPGLELDDDLMHLFEGSPTATFKTPRKTPTKTAMTPRSQRHFEHLLKTPTPASRKRKPLSPNPNAANATTAINDFMTSPSSNRYFLRSTPSRQERTPGRQRSSPVDAANALGEEMTPFSRHIAQMLSEANGSAAGAFTSPARALDFNDLPAFSTPGKNLADVDWMSMGDLVSSDYAAFDEAAAAGKEGSAGGEEQT